MISLMVIFGSVREERKGESIAKWVVKEAEANGQFTVDYVDLKQVPLPFYNEADSPDKLTHYANPEGKKWADRVGASDAFIFVVPEYNKGPSAVIKNAVDWVGNEWSGKPVSFVGYGGRTGGTAAVMQLQQNTINVGLEPFGRAIYISNFEADFHPTKEWLKNSLDGIFKQILSRAKI